MVVLARCVGLIGQGWAGGVAGDALANAGCSVVALDDQHHSVGDPFERGSLVDVVVIVGDELERVRTATRYGVGCLQIRSRPPSDDELAEALLAGANGVITDSSGVADLVRGSADHRRRRRRVSSRDSPAGARPAPS